MQSTFKGNKFLAHAFGMMELKVINYPESTLPDFRFIRVHTSFTEIGNYNVDELVGKSVTEVLPKMDTVDPNWIHILRKSFQENKAIEVEEYGVNLQRWLLIQVSPCPPDRVILLINDITKEKEYQSDLHRFLELDLEFFAICQSDLTLTQINLAWEKNLGYSANKLIGTNLISLIHSNDVEFTKKRFDSLQKGQQIDNLLNRIQTHQGEYRYLEWRVRMIDDIIYASARDVTDQTLKHNQKEYYSDLESLILKLAMDFIHLPQEAYDKAMNDMLAIIGQFAPIDRGYIFRYNFEDQTGSNTHEWCAPDVIPEKDNQQNIPLQMFASWVDEHKAGQIIHIPDVEALPTDSVLYQFLSPQQIKTFITIPLIYKEECLGFVGFDNVKTNHPWTKNEVSILKMMAKIITNSLVKFRMTDELVAARDRAEHISRAKSQFLANMSHEIRTPLNAVIGFTDLLRNTALTETQKQYVETAYLSANTLMDIISEELDFSKIEAGKLELDIIETDLIRLVEQAIDMVKHHCAQKGLELLMKLDWSLPRFIIVDPVRLKQILTNLLGNAVKFTEKGEIEFEVKFLSDQDSSGKGIFQFLVRDTGIGITEVQRDKIFKAFSQADSSTTRRYGGTGLGLAISNGLLDIMGSQIKLDSKYGHGSTFSFELCLPYRRGREIREEQLNHLKKVLIVDNNVNQQLIIADSLNQWEIKSFFASNGLSAMELLNQNPHIDLLLLDYDMPHLNGIDTLRLVRKQALFRHLQVILMTPTIEDEEIRIAANDLGKVKLLSKPLKAEEFFNLLNNLSESEPVVSERISEKEKPKQLTGIPQKIIAPRILLVEDFPMNRLLIKTIVSGFLPEATITEAVNGIEAIKEVERYPPDLIFMDIQMPQMDGYDATIKIRSILENTSHRPIIIALTANALKGEREKCLSMGMDDYLTKPIQKDLVKKKLHQYLKLETD
ncbi:MAG: response regulator [Saprospiraceae bacterium]|nr:response regulator [Saprospiraceae bacterium]